MSKDILQIFQETAGITAPHLSLFVRTTLCALFLIWAAWTIHRQYHAVQEKNHDIHDLPVTILRVLLLCSLMIALVFVQ